MDIVFYDSKELMFEQNGLFNPRITLDKISDTEELLEYIKYVKEGKFFNWRIHVKLISIEEPLINLNTMIGLKKLKKDIVYQIIYYCKHEDIITDNINCVFYGPPGCGKTSIAFLFGKLFLKLGHLKNDKFVVGTLENMIAQYVGQTAPKTKKLIDSARGGVLFIDEAYQFGSSADNNRDSFSKQAIDTINQDITANPGSLMYIVAGYKDKVKNDFFAQNAGLERRFPWVYTIDAYSPNELYQIFCLQCKEEKYKIEFKNINSGFFEKNKDYFNYSGGDTRLLVDKCKRFSSVRYALEINDEKIIIDDDFLHAFDSFKNHKDENKIKIPDKIKEPEYLNYMYI